jgi:F0F1-type ATP synthase assembly protein I
MQPADRPAFQPAAAGGVLLGTLCTAIGVGLLVGWLVGAIGIGALIGTMIGIPLAVFVVYRRFRGWFTG